MAEAVAPMCSVKKMLLKNSKYPQKNTCAKTCNFIKKETMAQVFSCECCEIFKNTFLYRTPPVATSILNNAKSMILSTSEIIPENFFSKQQFHTCFQLRQFKRAQTYQRTQSRTESIVLVQIQRQFLKLFKSTSQLWLRH